MKVRQSSTAGGDGTGNPRGPWWIAGLVTAAVAVVTVWVTGSPADVPVVTAPVLFALGMKPPDYPA